MKKKTNYLMMTITATLLTFMSCSSAKKEEPKVEVQEKAKIKIEQVYERDVAQLFEYTAIVQANVTNNIAPTMPLRIDKIFVEVGDNVSKGQLLVQLDETNVKQVKAQLDLLQSNFKRMDELYKVGAVSQSDWDALKMQLEVQKTSYENLLTNTQLRSPINGIVTARNNDAGDLYAGNSMQFPILQVQQITPVKMLINVSENQFKSIKKGMSVDIKLDALDNEVYKGKVNLVYPTIDRLTHTFPVEITLPNANGQVRPGMYARVVVDLGSKKHIVVPDVSVVKQQGSGDRYVYVYRDGKVDYVKVTLGRRLETAYEVLSGLQEGDKVATTSLNKLNNGTEVTVVE